MATKAICTDLTCDWAAVAHAKPTMADRTKTAAQHCVGTPALIIVVVSLLGPCHGFPQLVVFLQEGVDLA